jgi:hypothetical protein
VNILSLASFVSWTEKFLFTSILVDYSFINAYNSPACSIKHHVHGYTAMITGVGLISIEWKYLIGDVTI